MKKKFLRALLFVSTVICLLLICAVGASADEYSGECGDSNSSITWKLDTNFGILQINGSGNMADYAISGTRAAPWSDYAKYITTVSVSNDISSLGKYAFAYCKNVKVITLPSGLTSLPDGLFYGCSSLETVEIGAAVSSIDKTAFYGCGALENIKVSGENTIYSLVEGCLVETATNTLIRSNSTGTIPASVVYIGYGALSGSSKLESIVIPDAVKRIGYGAFSGCSSLSHITLPFVGDRRVNADGGYERFDDQDMQNSQTLFDYIFGETGVPEALKTVVITDTENISNSAFSGCRQIVSITLPENLIVLGENAFSDCIKLTECIIPNSVKTIGKRAFYNCLSLLSVNIGKGVTAIGNGAFANCKALESIEISSENTMYRAEGNCVIDKNNLLVFGCNSSVIPQGITAIADEAFYGCGKLSLTEIPTGVISIGASAFFDCTELKTIILPNTLKSLGEYAFANCTGLTYIGIPDTIEKYGDSVFANCISLKSPGMPYTAPNSQIDGFSGCATVILTVMIVLLVSASAVIGYTVFRKMKNK